jgi:hypothetical protein
MRVNGTTPHAAAQDEQRVLRIVNRPGDWSKTDEDRVVRHIQTNRPSTVDRLCGLFEPRWTRKQAVIKWLRSSRWQAAGIVVCDDFEIRYAHEAEPPPEARANGRGSGAEPSTREKRLRQQEIYLRLEHRMQLQDRRTSLGFKAWTEAKHINLVRLYSRDRRKLGALACVTADDYKRFATDPMGRTRKDASGAKRPDARFPSAFIPGEFTEAQAATFRTQFQKAKRAAAERRRRAKLAAAHVKVEKSPGLSPRQKAIVRAFDGWMTVREAAKPVRRSTAWRCRDGSLMAEASVVRLINRMVPGLAGHLDAKPGQDRRGWPMRKYRRR